MLIKLRTWYKVRLIILLINIINIINITFIPFGACADKSKQPLSRFVTIKFNEVNARTGPTANCPIEWIFIKKGEPVEIIAEYDQWRKVRDINGEGGWIHSAALSIKRSVVIISDNILPLLEAPEYYNRIVAKLNPKIRCGLVKCKKDWCQLMCKNYKGWVPAKFLWGIHRHESS